MVEVYNIQNMEELYLYSIYSIYINTYLYIYYYSIYIYKNYNSLITVAAMQMFKEFFNFWNGTLKV